jgi:hypothetical protein
MGRWNGEWREWSGVVRERLDTCVGQEGVIRNAMYDMQLGFH